MLKLNCDHFLDSFYFETEYDCEGEGHAIYIKEENQEAFVEEQVRHFRQALWEALEDC